MNTDQLVKPAFELANNSNDFASLLGLTKSEKFEINATVACEEIFSGVKSATSALLESYSDNPRKLAYGFYRIGQTVGEETNSMGDQNDDDDDQDNNETEGWPKGL